MPADATPKPATTMAYDARGRLARVEVDSDGDGTVDTTTTYAYGDDGIRVSQTENGVTTLYVIDHNNPTGHAQTIEEGVDDNGDGTLQPGEVDKTYPEAPAPSAILHNLHYRTKR